MKYIISTAILLASLVIAPVYAGIPYIDSEANMEDDNPEPSATALMRAAYQDSTQKLVSILKNGADVNEKTKWGETALMYASRHGRQGAVELLLKNQADPNIKTADGMNTALILASAYAGPNIVRLLLENGADPNILPDTWTMLGNEPALEIAVEAGKIENVRLLLEHGAKMRDSLASAIARKRIDIVKLLIQKGASVRRNIPTLGYTKSIATPEIKQLLDLDQYQLLGKEDSVYPDSLDELAGSGPFALARKLYTDPKFVIENIPMRGVVEDALSYLETKVVKNAIFARHGYAFDVVWLRNYYIKHFDTYRPKTKDISLSAIDKKNLAYIKYLEKVSGNRK